jgi:polyisoprenoid-binding protein YceI
MARPPATPGANRPRGLIHASRLRLALGLAALLVVGGAAYAGWYLFLRPAGPPPVDLAALPASTASPNATLGASSATAAATLASSAAPSGSAASSSAVSLDGTWYVTTSIGSGSTGSFVGYRVQETLASLGANTAVGRTSSVSGSLTLQSTSITAAKITADLTGLQSDDSRRDGQLSHLGLETSTYPTATFVLSQPIDLGSIPASGKIVSVTATGQLTLHGQTRTVQIAFEARLSSGVIAVTGSLPITFADYGITPPTSFIALSVENHGTMELQLMFTHA